MDQQNLLQVCMLEQKVPTADAIAKSIATDCIMLLLDSAHFHDLWRRSARGTVAQRNDLAYGDDPCYDITQLPAKTLFRGSSSFLLTAHVGYRCPFLSRVMWNKV